MLASRRSRTITFLLAGTIAVALVAVLVGSAAGARVSAAGAGVSAAGVGVSAAGASATPGAAFQPYGATPCLLPFPNNLFTRPDHTTPTGLRVSLPANAMPVNTRGQRVGVSELDRNDGFSPGSVVILHVPGLDNPQAFARTGAVGLANMANMAQAFDKRGPIVVIDESTGSRQLIWSELDANATTPQTTNLLIHPGKNFTEGHTYIVALRQLRTTAGRLISAPCWFERLRDNRSLPAVERSQRTTHLLNSVTTTSPTGRCRAGLRRSASPRSTTSRRSCAGSPVRSPRRATWSCAVPAPRPASITARTSRTRCPRRFTATWRRRRSSASFRAAPAILSRPGSRSTGTACWARIEAGNVEAVATEHNMVFCATDRWGLAEGDVPNDVTALTDLNHFPGLVDRLQQGVLNTLCLATTPMLATSTNRQTSSGASPPPASVTASVAAPATSVPISARPGRAGGRSRS